MPTSGRSSSSLQLHEFCSDYDKQGFVIIPGLIPPEKLPELERACDRAISRVRTLQWKHRRVVGKHSPPWGDENPDSWGVQHIMHPDLEEPVFAQLYASDPLVQAAKTMLDCKEDELQMGASSPAHVFSFKTERMTSDSELLHILINPTAHDFALKWHRDGVPRDASVDQEREALTGRGYGVRSSQNFR